MNLVSIVKKRVPSPFYLLDKGVIDKDEFKSMKQKIINKWVKITLEALF